MKNMEAVVLEIIKKESAVLAKNGRIIKLQRSDLWPGDIIEISEADLQKNGSNRIDRTNHFYEKITHYATAAVRALMPCSAVGYKKIKLRNRIKHLQDITDKIVFQDEKIV